MGNFFVYTELIDLGSFGHLALRNNLKFPRKHRPLVSGGNIKIATLKM